MRVPFSTYAASTAHLGANLSPVSRTAQAAPSHKAHPDRFTFSGHGASDSTSPTSPNSSQKPTLNLPNKSGVSRRQSGKGESLDNHDHHNDQNSVTSEDAKAHQDKEFASSSIGLSQADQKKADKREARRAALDKMVPEPLHVTLLRIQGIIK